MDTVSLRQIDHYSKVYESKAFVDFQGNKINLQNISKVPVAMFVGEKDDIATPADSKWAFDEITSGDKFY
jgi:poly(3-hydroxyalkanoate) synthetase